LLVGIDSEQPRNGPMILKLHNNSPLGKRRRSNDSFRFLRPIQDRSPISHHLVAGDRDIGCEADDLPLELPFETGHDRDDDDENADPEHDTEDRN
jgi:hypothetical protein